MPQAHQHRYHYPHEPGRSAGPPHSRPVDRRGQRLTRRLARALATALVVSSAPAAWAQAPSASLGAQAIVALDWADATPGARALGEIRVVQPAVHLHAAASGHLQLVGMLNLEGATIPQGELAVGDWGEGFVDRRHPHTYLHELVLSADDLLGSRDGGVRVSVSAGKGFAPFGTDDPMVRGFLQYPVNHHLAQILERAVAIGALRAGPVLAEAGVFNGDEPERPGQWPRIGGRFGDSWSARLTAMLHPGLTLEGSRAHVHSPEHRPGAGTDQSKWSLAGRYERPLAGHPVYALAEWARTSEAGGFFVFTSLLAEGAWTAGRHRLQYRFERTERPEEERIARFRSLRPHLENSILGITRWTIHTLGYRFTAMERSGFRLEPVAEVRLASIAAVRQGLFDIAGTYGGDRIWSLSVGFRLAAGAPMHRMGRYGAASDAMTQGREEMPGMPE